MRPNPKQYRALLIGLAVIAIAAGVWFRVYRVGFPAKQVFDEVYFPVFAAKYLRGEDVFDVHPPLGKFIIAAGIWLLGDNERGWRLMPLLFGVGIIPLFAALYWRIFKDRVGAVLLAAFVAVDGMFLVYSRIGLMDGILMFAIFLALLAAASARLSGRNALWSGLALGAGVAMKWPALAALPPMLWLAWNSRTASRRHLLALAAWLGQTLLWAAALYLLIVYAGEWRDGAADPWASVWTWHVQAYEYHRTLTATHPWGSPWWSWPLLKRPVLLIYDTLPGGRIQVMTTLGNPLLWWSGVAAVAGSVAYLAAQAVRRRPGVWRHPVIPLLIGYLAFWLPWAGISRVVFLYHYFPSYGFSLMILAYWLGRLWRRRPALVVAYVTAVLLVALWYLPFATGWLSLTPDGLKERVVVNSWLY